MKLWASPLKRESIYTLNVCFRNLQKQIQKDKQYKEKQKGKHASKGKHTLIFYNWGTIR